MRDAIGPMVVAFLTAVFADDEDLILSLLADLSAPERGALSVALGYALVGAWQALSVALDPEADPDSYVAQILIQVGADIAT